MCFVGVDKEPRQGGVESGGGPASKMKCRRAILSEMGVHYNSFLLKQKENSGRVTATFRDIV